MFPDMADQDEHVTPDMAHQDEHVTPDMAHQDEHVTTVDQPTSCNVVSENDGPVRDDEPIIEIPVVSESSREMFKLRVTLADFCKLPVKQVVKCDGAEHYLIGTDTDTSPSDNKVSLCASSSTQISSSTSGADVCGDGGVVNFRTGSSILPTQVGVDNDGNVRRDFPFNGKTLSTKEKKVLCTTTLIKARKSDAKSTSECASESAESHVFGVTAAEHLAENLANIAIKSGRFPEDLLSDAPMFPTGNSEVSGQSQVDGDASTEDVNVVTGDANSTCETTTLFIEKSTPTDEKSVVGDTTMTTDTSTTANEGGDEKSVAGGTTMTADTSTTPNEKDVKKPVAGDTMTTADTSTIPNEKDVKKPVAGENDTTTGDTTSTTPNEKDVKKPVATNETVKTRITKSGKNACTKLVSGGSGGGASKTGSGEGEPKRITIVVNSNIDGVVETVSKRFREYKKTLKPGLDLKLHPVVHLTHLDTPPNPEEIQATPTVRVVPVLTTSVNDDGKDEKKRLKVYVDEELQLEKNSH